MGVNEEAALSALSARLTIIDAVIEKHGGRVFGAAGDSVVASYSSTVEAVRSAVEIQNQISELNEDLAESEELSFRIGVNFGDVILEEGNVFGDGVNVAARLEALAPSGGVCISKPVAEQISGKIEYTFASAGTHRLKNIANPIEVWCWPAKHAAKMRRSAIGWQKTLALVATITVVVTVAAWFLIDKSEKRPLPTGPRIVIIPFKNLGGSPDDAFFSDGLTKDINAYLSKFSNLCSRRGVDRGGKVTNGGTARPEPATHP